MSSGVDVTKSVGRSETDFHRMGRRDTYARGLCQNVEMAEMEYENLVAMFDEWCEHSTSVAKNLTEEREHSKQLDTTLKICRQRLANLETEHSILQDTLNKSQCSLNVICELEDQICNLKQEVKNKEQALQTEASLREKEISSMKVANQKAMEELTKKLQEECDSKVQDTAHRLECEELVKKDLLDQLKTATDNNTKEIAKITMEYEAKLRKVQQQNSEFQQQHRQILNQDVMRKKMQYLEKENQSLKAEVRTLQDKQVSSFCSNCRGRESTGPQYMNRHHWGQTQEPTHDPAQRSVEPTPPPNKLQCRRKTVSLFSRPS